MGEDLPIRVCGRNAVQAALDLDLDLDLAEALTEILGMSVRNSRGKETKRVKPKLGQQRSVDPRQRLQWVRGCWPWPWEPCVGRCWLRWLEPASSLESRCHLHCFPICPGWRRWAISKLRLAQWSRL